MSNALKIMIPHDLNNNYLNLVPLINKFETYSQFSEICLYHAYQPPDLGGKNMPQTLKSLIEDDEKNIENILNTQAEIFRNLIHSNTKLVTRFKRNKPVPGIINFINSYDPDIIMMTTRKKTGVSMFINTSYTLKLMNMIDVPILILPRNFKFKRELRLNFLIEHFKNIEVAKFLSRNYKSIFKDIRFIHIDPTLSRDSTDEIKVIPSIEDFIKKSKYDEVFMLIRKKKSKLQTVMTKGFVERLIGLNQAPVIIVNE